MIENTQLLIPILHEEKGYFLLGNEDDANETYYFNVFITYGKNLQLAINADDAGSSRQGAKYYFRYNLFGIAIVTEKFENLRDTNSDFLAEKASARILTTASTLERFFKETLKMSPFHIDLCTDNRV
jgi:hypothetical protein